MRRAQMRVIPGVVLIALGAWPVPTAGVSAQEVAGGQAPQGVAPKPSANRFDKARHDEIMAAPGRADGQVVFIGDSITFGWTEDGAGKSVWDKEYVAMKAQNLGVVCDCTENVLWRLDQGELEGMKKLKAVVLHIGTNDIGLARRKPEDVAAGVAAVVEKLKEKAPQAKVLLMGITPKGRGGVNESNALIAKLEDGKRVFYRNINEALQKTPGTIKDRVGHLTQKGYEVWAEQIRPTLKKLME